MKRGLAGFARWIHPPLALRCFSCRMGSGDQFTDYCSKTNYDPHAVFAFDDLRQIFKCPLALPGNADHEVTRDTLEGRLASWKAIYVKAFDKVYSYGVLPSVSIQLFSGDDRDRQKSCPYPKKQFYLQFLSSTHLHQRLPGHPLDFATDGQQQVT